VASVPASHRDLLDAQTAIFATIDDGGLPQLTAVWFLAAGDEIRLSFNTTRRKVANLRSRPECSLLILDPTESLRYLEVRGNAIVEDDAGRAWAARIGAKYGAGDMSGFDAPGDSRVVVRIDPVKIHAVDLTD
jgi:PPOX class probable F420-dependent enzyme